MKKKVSEDVDQRLTNDPRFVNLRRFDYDLYRVVERYPDGAPSHLIAQALNIPEKELDDVWTSIVQKIRGTMGVKAEEEG